MKMTKLMATILTALTFAGANAWADSPVPKEYPLKTCPVSGEELGSDGMVPHKVTADGTEVWLCCKSCMKKFTKDSAKYTQVVKDAAAKK